MLDFGTNNYGTYHDAIIPQPDEPLTTGWGSAIAWNVAKMTITARLSGTADAKPATTIPVTATIANFSKIPIIKGYNWTTGEGWTDRLWQGTGNTMLSATPSEHAFLQNLGAGTGQIELTIDSGADPFIIIQYGQ